MYGSYTWLSGCGLAEILVTPLHVVSDDAVDDLPRLKRESTALKREPYFYLSIHTNFVLKSLSRNYPFSTGTYTRIKAFKSDRMHKAFGKEALD